LDWTWHRISSGITAYYLDGFHEDVFHPAIGLFTPHYVSQTWLFDVRASYTFNFVPPVSGPPTFRDKESVSPPVVEAAKFGCSGWRQFLNGTTLTIGCNNVFGQDPPFSGNTFVHYPQFLYDPT